MYRELLKMSSAITSKPWLVVILILLVILGRYMYVQRQLQAKKDALAIKRNMSRVRPNRNPDKVEEIHLEDYDNDEGKVE